jgi:hemolysin III
MEPSRQIRKLSKDGSTRATDEFYNTLISLTGAGLALIGSIRLVWMAVAADKPWHIWSFSIYGVSLVCLFIASALHHGVDGSEKLNLRFRQIDYYAIFTMIAGTFTPFCLILFRNRLGYSVLGLVWFLAIFGIFLKAVFPHLPKWISTSLYLLMGWLAVVLVKAVYQAVPWGFVGLAVGGFFFSVGAVIFSIEKPNPVPGRFGFHEIWHLFVLAGAACHFAVIYFCLSPLP